MLCGGFFQIRSEIPPWFIWLHWMAFHTYAFRAAVINEFRERGILVDSKNPEWQVHGIEIKIEMISTTKY